jgi:hypothetical protein
MTYRKLLALTPLFALAVLATDAHATTLATYESVDSYTFRTPYVEVTGVLQGASAPSTTTHRIETFASNGQEYDSCERMLLTAMNRPGRFFFSIDAYGSDGGHCRLTRRP